MNGKKKKKNLVNQVNIISVLVYMEAIIDIDRTWTKSFLHVCPLSEDPII